MATARQERGLWRYWKILEGENFHLVIIPRRNNEKYVTTQQLTPVLRIRLSGSPFKDHG